MFDTFFARINPSNTFEVTINIDPQSTLSVIIAYCIYYNYHTERRHSSPFQFDNAKSDADV
jgi:hypothetical protein